MAEKGEASIIVSGLSGNVCSELQFDIGLSIHELKKAILPAILPGASEDAKLKLFFDGNEPDDDETLASIGIDASDQAHFTALVYDIHALAQMEINQMHREAIERSRQEAEEARKRILDRRKQLIAERRQEVESEYANRHGQTQGPLLMLAAEPANLPDMPRNENSSSSNTAGVNAACGQAVAQHVVASSDLSQGLLMLTAHPAHPEVVRVPIDFGPGKSPSKVSPDWHVKAKEISAAYDAFFDHISFRKGWKQPPFAREEVAPLFAAAACIVARARIEMLDMRDEGIKLRQVEGSARDWMHSPTSGLLVQSNPDLFVKGLVHATFKDAKGYVEGLKESEVDRCIELYSLASTALVN